MKRAVKVIIEIAFGACILLLACKGLNYLYVDYDAWHSILFNSYYDQENIDNLFLGSSHVYCDVDPAILDGINGQNNFNLATPLQRWDDTYYLLRESLDRYDVKNVYIECHFWVNTEHEAWIDKETGYRTDDWIRSPGSFSRPWLITYEMKPSVNSLMMLLKSADADHMMEIIFPFVRFRMNAFNWEQIRKNIDEKKSPEAKDHTYRSEGEDADGSTMYVEYRDKGGYYSGNSRFLDREKIYHDERDFTVQGIGKISREYMKKTIRLCKDKGVNIKLYVSPMYDLQLISSDDYDRYVGELRALADECGVELYDFNLIKKEYLDIKDGDLFMDVSHLNGDGAGLFTPVLWSVLNGSKEENADKFYDSYKERQKADDPEIFGLYYKDINPGEEVNYDGSPIYTTRNYTIASNRDDMEYRVVRTIKDGDDSTEDEQECLQEWDKNRSFDIPIDQHGVFTVEGRSNGQELKIEIDY